MLGLAILDPAAWQPTRTWVLVFVVVKTAFAAWAVAVRTRFGTRRIPDLDGWARRSPGLAVAFALIVLATIGLPGLLTWDARARLVELSVSNDLMRLLVTLGGLASLAYYGRIALAGARAPSVLVTAGPSELPRRPDAPAEDAGPGDARGPGPGRLGRQPGADRLGRGPRPRAHGHGRRARRARGVDGRGRAGARAGRADGDVRARPDRAAIGQPRTRASSRRPSRARSRRPAPSAGSSATPTGRPSATPTASRAPTPTTKPTAKPSGTPSPTP